jgi:hypothetical protein
MQKYLGISYHKGSLLETNLLFVVNNGMQESHCPTGIAVKRTDVKAIRHELQEANNKVYIPAASEGSASPWNRSGIWIRLLRITGSGSGSNPN